MKIKNNIFILIIILLTSNLNSQKFKSELKTIMVIGDNEDAPGEYLFKFPIHVTTDSQNNIYIC